jgi:diketogulonate reductase-like aldo/keto reductase
MHYLLVPLLAVSQAGVPAIKLNNGVVMPMVSIGTWQYNSSTAQQVVSEALRLGYNHVDTANDYNNQDGVGKALASFPRSSYFLTTKVPGVEAPHTGDAYNRTKASLAQNLQLLGLSQVDLVLVHFPPVGNTLWCSSMQETWRAMEEFYNAGLARAIGVSNYCESSFDCILKTATVVPAVNQVGYHVGMGLDPIGIRSYCNAKGVVVQAYSPLGDDTAELISGPLVTSIGGNHNKTGAQVSMHGPCMFRVACCRVHASCGLVARRSRCAGSTRTECRSPPRAPAHHTSPRTWRSSGTPPSTRPKSRR